ncbi:MAG: class IV adenylate cyclase [Acidobacteriaceae bacterium]
MAGKLENQEIEIKIKLSDAKAFRAKLLKLGATLIEEGLESDIYFTNKDGFYGSGQTLRLRNCPKGWLLTYKKFKNFEYGLSNRQEIQTLVSDGPKLKQILEALGFYPHIRKQKQIEHYQFKHVVVEMHKLPFLGDFIEIEGERHEIEPILSDLGLSFADGLQKNYNRLFEDYIKEHALPQNLQLTFEDEKKFNRSV